MVAVLTAGSFGALAQSDTGEARDQIRRFLQEIISQMPNDAFLQRGIASEDIDRAKTCSVLAIIADIPGDAIKQIAELLGQSPIPRDKLIEHWLLPDLSRDVERREQINAQVAKICPEFQDQLREF